MFPSQVNRLYWKTDKEDEADPKTSRPEKSQTTFTIFTISGTKTL